MTFSTPILWNNSAKPKQVLKNLEESLVQAQNAALAVKRFRLSTHQSSGIIEKIDLSKVAHRTVTALSEKARRAKMKLIIELDESLPQIHSSLTAIEQLFFIIIQNAIEAADGKDLHNLIVSAESTNEHIELRFRDDCCGIEAANIEKIFEPFFTTKTEQKGMGLGLEIVQRILMSYGGQIRTESKPGKGATFIVTLPLKIE